VDTDEKGPYILQSEVEKVIKEMRNKKATGDDDVPGDVLKLLGEGGLKKLINAMYETAEWLKDRSYNDCLNPLPPNVIYIYIYIYIYIVPHR
jgi:hypothetical protein